MTTTGCKRPRRTVEREQRVQSSNPLDDVVSCRAFNHYFLNLGSRHTFRIEPLFKTPCGETISFWSKETRLVEIYLLGENRRSVFFFFFRVFFLQNFVSSFSLRLNGKIENWSRTSKINTSIYIYIVLGYKESYKLELDISFLKMLIKINIIYIYLLGNKSEVSYISLIRIIRD